MKEVFPSIPQEEGIATINQTTLIIDDVPSDLAYSIFMESLSDGVTLSQEELSRIVEERMNSDKITIHYEEIDKFFNNVTRKILVRGFEDAPELFFERTNFVKDHESGTQEYPYTKEEYLTSLIEAAKEEVRSQYREEKHINTLDMQTPSLSPNLDDERIPLRRV